MKHNSVWYPHCRLCYAQWYISVHLKLLIGPSPASPSGYHEAVSVSVLTYYLLSFLIFFFYCYRISTHFK